MNKVTSIFTLVAGFFLLASSSAFAAIGTPGNVGQANATAAGTTLSVTVPGGGVALGNTVIVSFELPGTAGAVSVADSKGNPYSSDADVARTGMRTLVFSAPVTSALVSGDTITVTSPSVTNRAVSIYAVSGLIAASRVDVVATNTGNSGAPSSGASGPLSQANELCWGAIGYANNSAFSVSGGFTALANAVAGTAATIQPIYRIVTATNTQTASGATGGAAWAAAQVTYRSKDQILTFPSPGNQTYGVAPLTLGGVADSGLTVTYAVTNASVSGNTLTITNTGTVRIIASQAGDGNWNAATSITNVITISTKALTVTGITATDKVYDRTNTATLNVGSAALVGVVGLDDVTLNTASAVGRFVSSNVANNITVGISNLTITGVDVAKYTLTVPTTTANITAKSVTVTSGLTAASRRYNGTTLTTISSNIVVLAGVITPDLATLRTNGNAANFENKNVGATNVTLTGLSLVGGNAANYALTQPTLTANITVTNITVTATTNTKPYDGNTSAAAVPSISANGLQSGDANGFTEAYTTAAVGTGNKTLVPSGAVNDGNGGANYNVVAFVNFTAGTISAKALTVTGITATDKVYDRTNTASINVGSAVLVGVVGSEDVTLNTGSAIGRFVSSNVANNITVGISNLAITGADIASYTLTQPTTTADITAKSVTVTSGLTAASRRYNGATLTTISSNSVVLAGVISPDITTLCTNGNAANFEDKHVGTTNVILTGLSLVGGNAGNYALTQPILNANITTTNITVTATTNTKLYDGNTTTTNTPTISASGLQSGDTNGFTEAYSSATVGVGNKTIVPSGVVIDGNGGANYNVAFVSFAAGTISARTLTVTGITAADKIYDRTNTATIDTSSAALVGVVGLDDVTLNTATAIGRFVSSNVANNITVGISNLSLTGTDSGNYTVTQPTTTADITPKTVTISSGLTAINRRYDGTVSATVTTNTVIFAGLISPDVLTLRTNGYTATFPDKHVETGKTVTLTNVILGGASSNNYAITLPISLSANITTTNLTVTARVNTKVYDGNTSTTNTPTVTFGSVQTGDTTNFTQAYSTAAVGVGSKTIVPTGTVGDGNGGTNYSVTFVNFTTGTINAKALTINATAQSKTYGDVLTLGAGQTAFTAVGLTNSETVGTVTLNSTGGTNANSAPGVYTLIPSAATGGTFTAGNYSIIYSNSTLTVNPAAIDHYLVTASSPQTVGAPFNITVTAKDFATNTVTTDSSTVVTLTSTGDVNFDSNNNGTYDDNTKTLTNGVLVITARAAAPGTVDLTATDGNSKTGTLAGVVINGYVVKTRVAGAANWSSSNTWEQVLTGAATFSTSTNRVTGAGTFFTSEINVGDVLVRDSDAQVIGTVAGITSDTVLTLVANSAIAASGAAYGRQTVPAAQHEVQIGNLVLGTVTVTQNVASATINSLRFISDNLAHTLIHIGTNQLIVNKDVTVNQPDAAAIVGWNINGGSAIVGGDVAIGFAPVSVASTRNSRVVLTTGTLTIGGDLVYCMGSGSAAGAAVLDLSGGAATVNLAGSLVTSNALGTLTAGTNSSFNFNGTTAQTVPLGVSAVVYNNLLFNNASANGVTVSTNITGARVTGNVTVQSGTFANGGFAITNASTKTFSVADGATFRLTGTSAMPVVSGAGSGVILDANSTVDFAGGTQTVATNNYGNLIIGAGAKTAGGALAVNGILTITNSTFDMSTFALSGPFTTAGDLNGVLQVRNTTATPIPAGKTWDFKVTYLGAGPQTIVSGTYQGANPALQMQNNQANTVSGDVTIGFGTLRLIGTSAANMNGFNLTISGNLGSINRDSGATFTAGSGTVTYNRSGAGDQTIWITSAITYNNLVLNGTGFENVPNGTVVSGNLSITGCQASVAPGANVGVGTLTLGGLGRINGTWGSTTSAATHQDNTYFDATTGIVTVSVDGRETPIVSVSPSATAITYGQALSASGLSGGAATNVVGGSVAGSFAFTTPATTPNAGTANQSVTFTPDDAILYKTALGTASVTVNPAALSITANNDSKTYGGTKTYGAGSTAFSSGGLLFGQSIGSVTITASGGTAAGDPTGSYDLTPSAATGGTFDTNNYAITYNPGTLTVNPRPAVLTGTRAYDETTDAAAAILSVSNIVGSDVVTVTSGPGTLASKNVGVQGLSAPGTLALGGSHATNYTISGASGAVTITAATLTYTADATNRVYGAANPAFTGTVTGFLGADDQGNATTGTLTFTSSATTTSNVGGHAITGSGLIANNDNYTFVQAAGNASALTITIADSGVRVVSSVNPSLPGASVGFTATVTNASASDGLATGTVQFLTNGVAYGSPVGLNGSGEATLNTSTLPHAIHLVSVSYAGDGNFNSSASSSLSQLVNTPPTPGTNHTLGATMNVAVNLSAIKVKNTDSDADGDTLSITNVSATSTNGGSVSLGGNTITYTPVTDYVGADSFTYTLVDSFGGTNTGTVYVTVSSTNTQPQRVVAITPLPDANVAITFAGIPTYTYKVQATTNLGSPTWLTIGITNAGNNGLFIYSDLDATNYPTRYYRSSAN